MKMHFVSTGHKFSYAYYIGIVSASKVGETKLWYTKRPGTEYFDRVVKSVESEQIYCPEFPVFEGRNEHYNLVSQFDYLIWKIVSEEGGSVMGLDSITIRPFHDLLEDSEILVGRDAETVEDSYCMHGATAIKGSRIALQIHEDSLRALVEKKELGFGEAGIIPFLNHTQGNPNIKVADFGVLGSYMHDGSPFFLYEKDGELLDPDCRTIPFYATWQHEKFNKITEESIKGTLLGRLVERTGI